MGRRGARTPGCSSRPWSESGVPRKQPLRSGVTAHSSALHGPISRGGAAPAVPQGPTILYQNHYFLMTMSKGARSSDFKKQSSSLLLIEPIKANLFQRNLLVTEFFQFPW